MRIIIWLFLLIFFTNVCSLTAQGEHYKRAMKYYEEAKFYSDKMHNAAKAHSLYEKATYEARLALKEETDTANRKAMEDIIKDSRTKIWAFEDKLRETKSQGRLAVGMTEEEVKFFLGEPTKIDISSKTNIIQKQWMYGKYPDYELILYFENDKLVNWQDRQRNLRRYEQR